MAKRKADASTLRLVRKPDIGKRIAFDRATFMALDLYARDSMRSFQELADEAFFSGTAAEVIPVIKADGRVIGTGKPGPISLRMIARFREITREGGTPIYS